MPRGKLNSILEQAGLKDCVMKCTVLIEGGHGSFVPCVPDPPGGIAAGAARAETAMPIRDAIAGRIGRMHKGNLPVPAPRNTAEELQAA